MSCYAVVFVVDWGKDKTSIVPRFLFFLLFFYSRDEKKKTSENSLDPEQRWRNRPDDHRRPSVTKAAQRQGPTNPIAVPGANKTTTTNVSSSKIPRLNATRHPVAASSGSPDSSGCTMDTSSLDLSLIGRNRSSSGTNSSQSSSTSSLVKPSRLLPPGSIVSAKLAAAAQVNGRRVTAPTSVRPSRLPVATTSAIGKRPDCRSTRSLPDGGSARSKVTTVIHRSAQVNSHLNGGRIVNKQRTVPATKSVRIPPHKTPTPLSVSKKKADTIVVAGGQKEKKKEEEEEECRPLVSAGGGGEMCRGPQGRPGEEGASSLSDDHPPPPQPPEVEIHLVDEEDSRSAETESGASLLPASIGLLASSDVKQQKSVIRPVSLHESASMSQQWTVRISIPAAESSELLTRMECERQSIRGSTNCLTASSTLADVELMELLERDLLLTEEEEEEEPTPTTPAAAADVETNNPQRSLSLPKSFLATRYGLVGLKAALPR